MNFIGDWAMTRSCTVWDKYERDTYGNISYKSVEFIDNIWFKLTNERFIDSTGQERTSNFKLITSIDNVENFQIDSYVVLDRDETTTDNPTEISDAYQVRLIQIIAADAVGSKDAVIVMG